MSPLGFDQLPEELDSRREIGVSDTLDQIAMWLPGGRRAHAHAFTTVAGATRCPDRVLGPAMLARRRSSARSGTLSLDAHKPLSCPQECITIHNWAGFSGLSRTHGRMSGNAMEWTRR